MSGLTVLRLSGIVFVSALLQVVVVTSLLLHGGSPDLLLVVVISIALLRGSVAGAVCGFAGGLVVDLLTLDTLGVTSLVLTLAGFWAGRYGETTGRDRRLAPLIAVGTITVLASLFGFVLRYMLGEDLLVRQALVTALLPALALNLVLALPVHWLVRRVLGEPDFVEPAPEVEVLAS